MKKYIGPIFYIGTVLTLFYTLFDLKNQVKEIPRLHEQVDSLNTELFIEKANSGKHEITREEILKNKYPKVYEEYNKFLETETE